MRGKEALCTTLVEEVVVVVVVVSRENEVS